MRSRWKWTYSDPLLVTAAATIASALLAGEATKVKMPLEVPFIQQERNGCGAATVAMVMHYWRNQQPRFAAGTSPLNTPDPAEIYQRLYQPDREGILLADMRRFLEQSGFHAFTLRGKWSDVEQHLSKGRPLIVGIRPTSSEPATSKAKPKIHFAVLTGVQGDYVWLNDPTRKKSNKVRRADFNKQWSLADQWMLLSTPSNLE